MRLRVTWCSSLIAPCALLGALALASPCAAQTLSGQARAVQSTVTGLTGSTTTVLTDTGTLGDAADAREASASGASVPSLLTADTPHATTIALGTQVDSEASLAALALTLSGTQITADYVMTRAWAVQGAAGSAITSIDGLAINGVPLAVDDTPNQVIAIPGGQIVVNEQQISNAGTSVNALHVTVFGVADVIVAAAAAAVQ
jgi:hypothetical protein